MPPVYLLTTVLLIAALHWFLPLARAIDALLSQIGSSINGVAILRGTLMPRLPIPIFAMLMRQRFILEEEAILTEIFGEEFLEYRNSVRPWV